MSTQDDTLVEDKAAIDSDQADKALAFFLDGCLQTPLPTAFNDQLTSLRVRPTLLAYGCKQWCPAPCSTCVFPLPPFSSK